MIFPVRGGRYNGVNKRIKKHEKTPISSTERIFIRSCRTGTIFTVCLYAFEYNIRRELVPKRIKKR